MNPYKQVRRLLKLADVIEKQEGRFDMGNWITRDEQSGAIGQVREIAVLADAENAADYLRKQKSGTPVTCGMNACLGGWAVLTWPKDAAAAVEKNEGVLIEEVAAEILGYDFEGLNGLFSSTAEWQTAEAAAAELRRRALEILQDNVSVW
jgi:hypothetical protein